LAKFHYTLCTFSWASAQSSHIILECESDKRPADLAIGQADGAYF
jgi:hypothetical protein